MKDLIRTQLEESSETMKNCIHVIEKIEHAAKLVIESLEMGGKVILFGNGGSAAQAQHIAAEFTNKFNLDRKAMPAISLTVDTSSLTCIANDSSYGNVFKRQLEALGKKEDVAVAITTSDVSLEDHGHSINIARGIETAKNMNIKVIGIFSEKSEKASEMVDVAIKIPSKETPRIQEAHITVMHIICDIVEKHFFG
ncbi:SIS domain-containing protein [Candidatus Aenigmatarchaeota archaeon]